MNLTGRPIAKKPAKPTAEETRLGKLHMRRVKQLPCVICWRPGPSDVHHVICGRYGTRRASDFETIPLCKSHHLDGPDAIHNGKESWIAAYGADHEYLAVVRDMLAGEHIKTVRSQ